ncbi:Gfo/Idh/MocA family protein [Lacisediminihabitans changchengi]|uniref:Gfo/Idh/MocA family oxidoreductase n=1 Tax=Lacisediminihabitans changchengi TaxID=2787634 RepID=A0A934SH75_9MICO|nr:Gfo/Idh/MocA family oxidoreductase [Lacisediminihabitans changchengi]MBK4346612.1 Gfo/Idh/MocA family oxidoreductase [Lacisediminihabitans changchengi]
MTAIRTGIIGYGLSGRIFHSPFIAANPDFSLDLISTSNEARAQQAREQHPSATVVATPDELLDGELDLVVLASPAQVHLEQAQAAIAAGIAVVIDKPFAASVVEATSIIEASEDAGVPLTVYQNRRWDGDFRTVQKLLADGTLGRVHRFESTFERWSPALRDRWQDTTPTSAGAGITFDLGSHLVDQAVQLFGPATLETAELSVLREGGVSDDEAFLSLLHESGVRSHLTMSRFAAQNAPRFRVLGSASGYTVQGLDGQEPALMGGAQPSDPGFGDVPEDRWGLLGITGSADVPPTPYPTERGEYAAFYAGVAQALRDGTPMPVAPRDALAALDLIEQAHRRTGI